jgi:hypothetical protein
MSCPGEVTMENWEGEGEHAIGVELFEEARMKIGV